MRFRAKVTNVETIMHLVHAVEKMNKNAVLRLTDRKFELILQTDVTEGVYVLASIPVSLVFTELRVESKTNNTICLDLQLDVFSQGLKRCMNSSEVLMKLLKRDRAYLSLIAEQSTTQLMTVTYDVPVEPLSSDRVQQLREPGDYEPLIYTLMPPLRRMKPIIEHMKNIGQYLTIRGNMNGELDFKVDAETISVATHFRNLEHPHIQGREAPQPDPNKEHTVKIDSSKFHKFLFSHSVNPQNVVLCLNVDAPVVIHVMHDDVYLTYYLPLITVD